MSNTIKSKNPYTGEVRSQFKYASKQEIEGKIKNAEKGFKVQQQRKLQERAQIIGKMAQVFEQNIKQIAQTISFEMGKPIKQAEQEVNKTIKYFKYYSKNYEPLKPKIIQTDAKVKTEVVYKPLGIVYLIVPFNFPLYLTFKGGVTNLLLGNCLLVKCSSNCPALGDLIQKLVRKAGFDQGQYQSIHASYDVLDQIFSHKSVVGVSFTGSTKAGSKIAAKAGEYLKKSVMELGGNDPFVVLKDADLQLSVKKAIEGRILNGGQVCFSPKRFIIETEVYQQFREKLIQGLKKIKYGDPLDKDTELGPLAKQKLNENLKQQISNIPKSYKIVWQREDVSKPFFPITVIEASDKQVYDVEMFGPVFTLYKADNQEHAIEIANQGSYGLGGEVFSKTRGQKVIDKIRCGLGFVNECVRSDYSFPSGGVANSGYGRECGEEGYKEFANIKVHYIN